MATDIKFVFIATGRNDPHRDNSFTERARNHVKWMVGQLNKRKGKTDSLLTRPALIRFVHFDWQNDKIEVYEHPFPLKGLQELKPGWQWHELSSFVATDGDRKFDPKSFITKSLPVFNPDARPPGMNRVGISIVDIYHAVREAPRGTVVDVSVYSHGYIEGPVLADTNDPENSAPRPGLEPIRTKWDLDGRRRSDFTPHMGEENVAANKDALKNFREGFATGATFRVFGCHVQDVVDGRQFHKDRHSLVRSTVLEVIRAAYVVQRNTPAGNELRQKKKPASVTLDMGRELEIEDELDNNFDKAQLKVLHYGLDPFFPDAQSGALKFPKPFTEVIKFVARQTKLGYVFKAAEALPDVTCFGAVPGSGGDYEEGGYRLMFVPRKDWGSILQFHKIFIGIALDERNYGRFDAAAVANINDHALNG
jgi:hypothetical protein